MSEERRAARERARVRGSRGGMPSPRSGCSLHWGASFHEEGVGMMPNKKRGGARRVGLCAAAGDAEGPRGGGTDGRGKVAAVVVAVRPGPLAGVNA